MDDKWKESGEQRGTEEEQYTWEQRGLLYTGDMGHDMGKGGWGRYTGGKAGGVYTGDRCTITQ